VKVGNWIVDVPVEGFTDRSDGCQKVCQVYVW